MSVLGALLAREENRNEKMIAEYNMELAALPKGSIQTKNVNGRTYYYLTFRDGDRVITRYIGKNEDSLISVQEQLARRKQVEEILKKLKEEKAQIRKLGAAL